MLISKFNKMIRNRVLWGVFAVIVVIAFVGAFSPGRGGGGEPSNNAIGVLYDKPVTGRELAIARFYAAGMRDTGNLSTEMFALLTKNAWRRLAALQTAERLGLTATDEEVATAIHRDPSFAVNGAFSRDRYAKIIQSQWRFKDSVTMFEGFLRQEITLKKLIGMIESAVWIAPQELTYRVNNLTDGFGVHYVRLERDDIAEETIVDEDQARDFFERNSELFRVPEKMNVRYVAYPLSNYVAQVTVSEEEITDYYDDNLKDYVIPGTNEGDGFLPLEDVRDEIEKMLTLRTAAFEAKDEATLLVVALAPDRAGKAPSFNEAAMQFHVQVATSSFFALSEDVPGLGDVGPEFNSTAFSLDPGDVERYFSDAVLGKDAAYVLAAGERVESHIPDFEHVEEEVTELATAEALDEAFQEKAASTREMIEERLATGIPFNEILAGASLNIATTVTFSAYESTSVEMEEEYGMLMPYVLSLEVGDLSDPLRIGEDFVLAYVVQRQPADLGTLDMARMQILSAMNRYRAELAFSGWQDDNLVAAGFSEITPPSPPPEDDEEE